LHNLKVSKPGIFPREHRVDGWKFPLNHNSFHNPQVSTIINDKSTQLGTLKFINEKILQPFEALFVYDSA
jgi:hypothetical protein